MKTITNELVDELIDFAPNEADKAQGFAQFQRDGTVAVFNMLAQNGCAYLADEVGMGKTYVALGVMNLLRYFKPDARVVIIAPRENIQQKWVKELRNFVRVNWRIVGNRVKALHGGPVWEPVLCNSLLDFANEALLNQDRDFFLRMTSFSVALSDTEWRKELRNRLLQRVPWLQRTDVSNRTRETFRDDFGKAINGAVPNADLVIVDEAHNLKHGFGERVSTRNRLMGLSFGHPSAPGDWPEWYAPRAKRVLMLSATPFEENYAAIQRQFDVFGFGDARLCDGSGKDPVSLKLLTDPEVTEDRKQQLLQRLLLRRVSGLIIADELHTKNMYRREWRRGGMRDHDQPISIEDPKQRLIVALMQKKVSEVLQSERFNNQFQIGMLSSFESFLQTVEATRKRRTEAIDGKDCEAGCFDDVEQNLLANSDERRGLDTGAIAGIARSYRERFGAALPHPKLDAMAEAHQSAFDTGEKTLIFVRRVATVSELAAKLEKSFDEWIRARMGAALPILTDEIDCLFARYDGERLRRPDEFAETEASPVNIGMPDGDVDDLGENRQLLLEEDEGGAETFFAWFFRGQGPAGVLSGAALQRNRLSSASSAYASLFDDDYVAWLLGAHNGKTNVPDALAKVLGESPNRCMTAMRRLAYPYISERSRQRDQYPRGYVVEAYQVAALILLAGHGGELGQRAEVVLEERYLGSRPSPTDPPLGFPDPTEGLGLTTVCTELQRRPHVRNRLWPEKCTNDFRADFRRREQRRELLSTMARLGAAYIDLYLLAIAALGSFSLGRQTERGEPAERLAVEYVDLLEHQMAQPGFHAFHELSAAADAFDHIIAVNFPDVPTASLPELARIYGATLQKQAPVGRMSGSVNKRMVRQFRMPGFPLVLISTDVLQEGEDLHTFCRRVVHYGITWTSSAMEQRTGRIDRIGGLVQRELDGSPAQPEPEALIQVYYPHLRDTVEVLQVRRVLKRLNQFLKLMHHTGKADESRESSIDTTRAWLEELEDVCPIAGRLESAFPVREEWLQGTMGTGDVVRPDWEHQFTHFRSIWDEISDNGQICEIASNQERVRLGTIAVDDFDGNEAFSGIGLRRSQDFRLELRSQVAGEKTLLWCRSEVEPLDLTDNEKIDALILAQQAIGWPKICVQPRATKEYDEIFVEGDILFNPAGTERQEVQALVERTACSAALLRAAHSGRKGSRQIHHDVDDLTCRIDKLTKQNNLPWTRSGDRVWIELSDRGRRQQVQFFRIDDDYVFISPIVSAAFVNQSAAHRRDLAFRTWRRNTLKAVVSLAFDKRERLIGIIEQPAKTLRDRELRFYVEMLAQECDRYEYILTGSDRV